MIEILLCQWLRATAAITAVVPANQIFAITLPKGELYPALKITRLNSTPEETFDGATGEETARIQIDYWAKDTDTIASIKKALAEYFDGLEESQAQVLNVSDLREQPSYEPKSKVFKQTLELTLSYKET